MTKTKETEVIEADLVETIIEEPQAPIQAAFEEQPDGTVIPVDPAEIVQGSTTTNKSIAQVDRLLELAVTSNADMAKLEKLLELKERYDKEEARKAFTAAMAAFKAEGLVIDKDRKVSFPHKDSDERTEYRHASIGNVIGLATPLLAKHGISHRWDRSRDEDRIKVRCVLTHKDGHEETGDWWDGPPDNSGTKNPLQQGSSTTTYLERYTFLAITGLATVDQDDDGAGSGPVEEGEPPNEKINEDQVNTIHSKVHENDIEGFDRWLKSSLKCETIADIPVSMYDMVIRKLDKIIKEKAKKK